ncbi:MAG: 3-dehydroquinate synthase [Clostridia bacterium]|nr:3-dehydroquinate synthase [Clostridia bacterium]
MVAELTVNLGQRSYRIICGPGLLEQAGVLLAELKLSRRCLIVTNPVVGPLYAPRVEESLAGAGFNPKVVTVPEGEEAKTLAVAARLYDAALEAGLDRGSAVIALGGGVVGDVAGFVAATLLRGVPFIQLPTTLLAQVDASVGGKVAVNHPLGKNLIGAFYQPRLVAADLATLRTLPPREVRAGLAEVIKYGVIAEADFFAYLENNLEAALNLDPAVLTEIVYRSCRIKARVVEADERESGLRAILNFGHTVGHALEALTGFKELHHGEGVAIGMVAASRLAQRRGWLQAGEVGRLIDLLKRAGLPVEMPSLDRGALLTAIGRDKKIKDGTLHMVLPRSIGKVEVVPVGLKELEAVLA